VVVAAAAGMKPPVAAAAAVVVDMDSEEGGGDLKVLVHMEHDVDFDDNWNLEGFGGMKK